MTTAIDFNKPVASDNYLTLLATLRTMFGASASLLDSSSYTLSNTPSGAKRFDTSTSAIQQYNGSSWVDLPLRAKFDKDGNQIDTTYVKTAALSDYLPKSGGTMTGTITFATGQTISGYLPLSGGTLTGVLTFSNGKTNNDYLPLSGGTLTGLLSMSSSMIRKTTTSSSIGIYGGTQYSNGAFAEFYGNDAASGAGRFYISAHNPSEGTYITLMGNGVSGKLTWKSNEIITEGSYATTAATTTSTASASSPVVIVKNYVNGASWYRVWSDGWVEQGGTTSDNSSFGTQTITFLKSFSNTNYFFTKSAIEDSADNFSSNDTVYRKYLNRFGSTYISKTATSIAIQSKGVHNWYACGY